MGWVNGVGAELVLCSCLHDPSQGHGAVGPAFLAADGETEPHWARGAHTSPQEGAGSQEVASALI